ncbi:4'-phosphopantetheinyl transferase family protein [Aureitalea marina]|uniref:4-phosphopantetheinyl transferase n=1 Tax=Aureitalea marina TaxID=930804 RepID=A0A2S7KT36_9FLAO|nr:4'-phosphopantetheinyl transferase family protein [Aureitalea marina]PQB05795.1 4-phosphopantetheinyl transferase [Aureitalea marina]
MPLYKTITAPGNAKVLIWKIEESFNELSKGVVLTQNCRQRVEGMKSEIHRRGFMSVRQLLAIEGYEDKDLYYDDNGKPHLNDGRQISITHSFTFSAIVISDFSVGIDIEMQRHKILRIARKFTPVREYRTLANEDALMRKLTMVWCAKESLYKSFAEKGVSFLEHIYVEDFNLGEERTEASISYFDRSERYSVKFLEFEGFTCAYAQISA